MNRKNLNTYRARFSQLRLQAFGINQILDCEVDIEIYQHRCDPELWKARPTLKRLNHTWEATSAETLMQLIEHDFEKCIVPWEKQLPWPFRPTRDEPPTPHQGKIPQQRKAAGA
jgi:hypothetical protein